MPFFTRKPPKFEARYYDGSPESTVDIQGWMLSQNVQSTFIEGSTFEDEENKPYPAKIVVNESEMEVVAGMYVIWEDGDFQPRTADELFTRYDMVQQ